MTETVASLHFRLPADPRAEMEYGTPYRSLDEGPCSAPYCPEMGYFVVTKHVVSNNPLGRLYTRCDTHQMHYEMGDKEDYLTVQERQALIEHHLAEVARLSREQLKASICGGCFMQRSANGSCGCE